MPLIGKGSALNFNTMCIRIFITKKAEKSGENIGPAHLGPKEIDGLTVPPGKVSTLLTEHLVTG